MKILPRRIVAYNVLVLLGAAILFLFPAIALNEEVPVIALIFPASVFALLVIWNITGALLSESPPGRRAYLVNLLLLFLLSAIGSCAIR